MNFVELSSKTFINFTYKIFWEDEKEEEKIKNKIYLIEISEKKNCLNRRRKRKKKEKWRNEGNYF